MINRDKIASVHRGIGFIKPHARTRAAQTGISTHPYRPPKA